MQCTCKVSGACSVGFKHKRYEQSHELEEHVASFVLPELRTGGTLLPPCCPSSMDTLITDSSVWCCPEADLLSFMQGDGEADS